MEADKSYKIFYFAITQESIPRKKSIAKKLTAQKGAAGIMAMASG